jgi:GNAT superfamily N-acetyltransferase
MVTLTQIRKATSADLKGLQDLYSHLIENDTRCPPDLAKEIQCKLSAFEGSAILVGEINGKLVTSCTLVVVPNLTRGGASYALIENVVTDTPHRGLGYGAFVLENAVQMAWKHGCYKVMLMTGSVKQSTTAFYERAGFEQSKTGFQKRRIPARTE